MFYQLSTGVLPFAGDSLATLMFKIANEPHPDVLTIKPDLPPCLKALLDRLLDKNPEQRYQTGAELAHDLRQCADELTGGGA
jgi:serine/threonine-protein kinase